MKETIVVAITMLALMIGQAADAANVVTGRVVGVADGDTITVLDDTKTQHRIRLVGIDAPESGQPFGQASKQSLSKMVYGKEVSVLWEKQDRYGRILGKVVHPSWGDVNLAQVKAGMAWHYKRYMADQSAEDRMLYANEETSARQTRKGLWADNNPTPPWDWRKANR